MNTTIQAGKDIVIIDLNEFKRNGIDNNNKAFIAAMGNVGFDEINVLKYLALRKLGLDYDGEDYTQIVDGAEIWYAASNFFRNEAK